MTDDTQRFSSRSTSRLPRCLNRRRGAHIRKVAIVVGSSAAAATLLAACDLSPDRRRRARRPRPRRPRRRRRADRAPFANAAPVRRRTASR